MLTSKELVQIAKETPGWRVDTTSNGHFRFLPPDGDAIIVGASPDSRDAKNNIARLKRVGLPIPGRRLTQVKRDPKVNYKVCKTCGQRKGSWEFYTDNGSPDGLQFECAICHTNRNLETSYPLPKLTVLESIEVPADKNTLDAALAEAFAEDEAEPIEVELDLERVAEAIPAIHDMSEELASVKSDLEELTTLFLVVSEYVDAMRKELRELAAAQLDKSLETRLQNIEKRLDRVVDSPLQYIARHMKGEES